MTQRIRLSLKNDRFVINTLRSKSAGISEVQKTAGLKMMRVIRADARRIIRKNAPETSQSLYESITLPTANKWGNQYGKGWRFEITSELPYAQVVESGGPPEIKRFAEHPDLVDWVIRVLPEGVANRLFDQGWMVVRSGGNPNYNTKTGMGFFRQPLEKHSKKTYTEFRNHVRALLQKR